MVYKNKLKFVIDNWYLDPIANKEKINYLIAALFNEEDEEDIEVMKKVHEDILTHKRNNKDRAEVMKSTLQKLKQKLI